MSQSDENQGKGNGSKDPWANPRSMVDVQDNAGPSQDAAEAPAETSAQPEGAPLADRVRAVLEQQINPALASHGGGIVLVDVKDDKVYVQLSGGCQGCAGARMTLKAGVERVLREQIPEVKEVIDATDHAGGGDPFYSPGS